MQKLICLRDDDTNYFTSPKELENAYGEFWGVLPVTLATIPFVHGSEYQILMFEDQPGEEKYRMLRNWELNATAEELAKYHRLYPVGDNTELVKYLKPMIRNGKVEIAQHGVQHRYNEFGAELWSDNIGLYSIRDGKEYLQKVFETEVNVLIPPSNRIDLTCSRYARSIGLSIVSSGGLSFQRKRDHILETLKYPRDIMAYLRLHLLHKPGSNIVTRCGVTRYGGPTFGRDKTINEMIKTIDSILTNNDGTVIVTHYRLMNEKDDSEHSYRDKYQEFLRILSSRNDLKFVTATEYIRSRKSA